MSTIPFYRRPAAPDHSDLRPASTLLTSTFGNPAGVSVADLSAGEGTVLLMQAVSTHHDPHHDHTCGPCLADHAVYLWACANRTLGKTASGYYICWSENFDLQNPYIEGVPEATLPRQLMPFGVLSGVAMHDGHIALQIREAALASPRDIVRYKHLLQNIANHNPPPAHIRREEQEALADLAIHYTCLFTGRNPDEIDESEYLDITELQEDSTYTLLTPHLRNRLDAMTPALLDPQGAARFLNLTESILGANPMHISEQAKQALGTQVSSLVTFAALDIFTNLSDEWWQQLYIPTMLAEIERGTLKGKRPGDANPAPVEQEYTLPDADDPFWANLFGN